MIQKIECQRLIVNCVIITIEELLTIFFISYRIHYWMVFWVYVAFIVCGVIVILFVNNTPHKIIVRKSDSIWPNGKKVVGIIAVFTVIWLVYRVSFLSRNDGVEAVILLLASSLVIITSHNTFIIADLILAFLFVSLAQITHCGFVSVLLYLLISLFFIIAAYMCSVVNRYRVNTILHKRQKDTYKSHIISKIQKQDVNEILNDKRITAVAMNASSSLLVFYLCNDKESYIKHMMSDSSYCYIENVPFIRKIDYKKIRVSHKKYTKEEMNEIFQCMRARMEKDDMFVKCRWYCGIRINGYRRKFPDETVYYQK